MDESNKTLARYVIDDLIRSSNARVVVEREYWLRGSYRTEMVKFVDVVVQRLLGCLLGKVFMNGHIGRLFCLYLLVS